MFHLIPASLHRALLRIAHRIRKVWWQVRRPRIAGCRVLALNPAGELLLIRQSYGLQSWLPPGGGLKRHEDPLLAAARELKEETGCNLTDAVQVAVITERLHGSGNQVHVIVGRTEDSPVADGREVVAAQFFPLDALPLDMLDWLRAQIPEWVTAAKAARRPDAGEPPRPPAPTA
jgi:8-oxo-dGTP pyrophosphatase MutT (NUDIX family)